MYIYILFIHICVCYIYIYMRMCIYVYICVYMCIYILHIIPIPVHSHTHIHIYSHIHTKPHTNTHRHTHTHTHIHTHTHKDETNCVHSNRKANPCDPNVSSRVAWIWVAGDCPEHSTDSWLWMAMYTSILLSSEFARPVRASSMVPVSFQRHVCSRFVVNPRMFENGFTMISAGVPYTLP